MVGQRRKKKVGNRKASLAPIKLDNLLGLNLTASLDSPTRTSFHPRSLQPSPQRSRRAIPLITNSNKVKK